MTAVVPPKAVAQSRLLHVLHAGLVEIRSLTYAPPDPERTKQANALADLLEIVPDFIVKWDAPHWSNGWAQTRAALVEFRSKYPHAPFDYAYMLDNGPPHPSWPEKLA